MMPFSHGTLFYEHRDVKSMKDAEGDKYDEWTATVLVLKPDFTFELINQCQSMYGFASAYHKDITESYRGRYRYSGNQFSFTCTEKDIDDQKSGKFKYVSN